MSRVVILHAEEDAAPARALAEKLRMMRLSTVYDEAPGPELREEMEHAICTLALWSQRSAARPDLIGEAAFAHNTGRLVHVRMHNAEPPLEFSQDPSVNLTGWRGEDEFPAWRELAAEITRHLDAARAAAAAAAAAAHQPPPPPPPPDLGFGTPVEESATDAAPALDLEPGPEPMPGGAFETHGPAPTDIYSDPPARGGSTIQLAVIGVITFIVVAAVGIGGYALYQNQHGAAEAAHAWRGVDQTDPAALRAFLDSPYASHYRAEAAAALEGLELARLEEAQRADTIEALEAFLHDFPDGRHTVQVRGRIAELRQAGPSATEVTTDPDALEPTAPGAEPQELVPAPNATTPNTITPSAPPVSPVPLTPAPSPGDSSSGPTRLTPPGDIRDTERDLRRALEDDAPSQ